MRQSTQAEAELERILNTLGGGALAGEFWREYPVGNWLIDFYFPAIKLAIEVDGGYHRAPLQWRRDLHKTAELEARGITVLRLTNAEVLGERARLIEKLRVAWRVARAQTSARTNMRGNSTGDRFEVREPAAPGYAVTPIIDMGSIELIFAEEIARTKQWAANTARRAVNTALLASMTGVEMVHVPFKGESPPALVELLAGCVELFFGNISAVLKLPGVQRKFAAQDAEVSGGTSAAMISFLEAERTRWKKVIDTARVTLD